ncbi:hypothetical protein Hanom_Chr08g00698421 [Helianthus anomalus]
MWITNGPLEYHRATAGPPDHIHMIAFLFQRQMWITNGPLEYNCDTSGTTRSYLSPLGNNGYTQIQEET